MHKSEWRETARLAWPIILAELGWVSMANVDVMMVGRLGATAIAACGLGSAVFYTVAMTASGVLLGMDTLVSHAFGAGDRQRARRILMDGLSIALLLIPAVMGIVANVPPFLARFGVDPLVLISARPYLRVLNWSTPALVIYFCLRRYLQALGVVRPIMWILLTANLLNLAGNWVLVFGHLGFPALGVPGSAWATFFSRVYMMLGLVVIVWRKDDGAAVWARARLRDFGGVRTLIRLGLPAAGQIGVEYGVFTLATILVSMLGADQLAGHQLALNTIYTTYMIPFGISSAAAVLVGQALGRGDKRGAMRSGWTAVALGAVVMCVASAVLLAAPRLIARLFTPDADVIARAAVLLRIAAVFELFDGLQVVVTGALRGWGDTRTPMLCHFAGYWLIGLPLGAWLCFARHWGAAGLWTGLSVGLILIGIALTLLWRRTGRGAEMVRSVKMI